MKWFDYAAPPSLPEAVALLSANPGAKLLAGGTDLLVQLRAGRKVADLVIDIKKIPELNTVYSNGGGLTLGAAVPCHRIYNDASIKRGWPALAETASIIGGTLIQGRASVGGNLCNASPSADTIPLLIALGATCRIAGPGGEREIPVEDFCVSPGKSSLAADEILVSLNIPPMPAHSGASYLRFIPRNEMDIAVVGVGAAVTLNGDAITDARVALAAVAPTPLYVAAVGEYLKGKAATDDNISAAAAIARDAAQPITDMRGTAEYRKHITGVLTTRALRKAIAQARQEAK